MLLIIYFSTKFWYNSLNITQLYPTDHLACSLAVVTHVTTNVDIWRSFEWGFEPITF